MCFLPQEVTHRVRLLFRGDMAKAWWDDSMGWGTTLGGQSRRFLPTLNFMTDPVDKRMA